MACLLPPLGEVQAAEPRVEQPHPAMVREAGFVRTRLHESGAFVFAPRRSVWRPMCGSDTSLLTPDEIDRLATTATSESQLLGAIAGDGSSLEPRYGLDVVFDILKPLPPGAAEALAVVERNLESQFSDDARVLVEILFDDSPGGNVLGGTTADYVQVPYPVVRDALVADMDGDDTIQSFLPTTETIPVRYVATTEDVTNEDRVFVTVANHEATIGAVESRAARLTFNSTIAWAFDPNELEQASCANDPAIPCCTNLDCPAIPGVCSNSDTPCSGDVECPGGTCGASGICDPKVFSFRDVLTHEMGHVLGFISAVDTRTFEIETLDLFRFQRSDGTGTDHNPDTQAEFTTTPRMAQRDPSPPFDDNDVVCDTIAAEYRMSDGAPHQGSHFAPTLSPPALMGPLFCPAVTLAPEYFQTADLALLDAVGWDLPPANTTCEQAAELGCGLVRWLDNTDVGGPPDPPPGCGIGAEHDGARWFSFTATTTSVRVATCDSLGGDATLSVFDGVCGALTEIACSEDGGCGSGGTQAEVCLRGLTVGETYYVQFSSKTPADRGQYAMELHCGCDSICADVCCLPLAAPLAAPDVQDMVRFFVFEPGDPGERAAVRITLASLHHPSPPNLDGFPPPAYSTLEGQVRWLGPVEDYVNSPALGTTVRGANTQCMPSVADWTSESLVYVTGAEVVPSSLYSLEFVSEACLEAFGETAGPSDPIEVQTGRWGDVASPYQDPLAPNLTQPNVFDITTLVDRVKDVPNAVDRPQAQLQPLVIDADRVPSVIDISNVVDAVKGFAFPFAATDVCAP